MTITIKIVNLDKVREFLKTASEKTKQNADNGIKQSGFFIQTEVQESIAGRRAEHMSVDTGRFLNSVKASFPKKFVAVVETDVEYAKFLEYGTSKIDARAHFRNTIMRNENKIKEFITAEVKKDL